MFRRLADLHEIPYVSGIHDVKQREIRMIKQHEIKQPVIKQPEIPVIKQPVETSSDSDSEFMESKRLFFEQQAYKKQALLKTCESMKQYRLGDNTKYNALRDNNTLRDNNALRDNNTHQNNFQAEIKIFHHITNPPLKYDKQNKQTIQNVLEKKESPPIPQKPEYRPAYYPSGLSAYSLCSDIPDMTTPPYDLKCLQNLFLQKGGTAKGSIYPSLSNSYQYNTLQTWGHVQYYLHDLENQVKQGNEKAILQFLGPITMTPRLPYLQGIEIFWFIPSPNPQKIIGFLRRTIEPAMVDLLTIQAPIAIVQITDIRVKEDIQIPLEVESTGGFCVSVNELDYDIYKQLEEDGPGWFQSLTTAHNKYSSGFCNPRY